LHGEVARAVGALNRLLPPRRFALMGPGRWGSRGDTALGVPVTYADIHNAGLLVEIAARRGDSVPELSFGTHFFQDLVEARIPYLPLYPEEGGAVLHRDFLERSPSMLGSLVPGSAHLEGALRVIEVPAVAGGRVLRVALNGEECEALGYLAV
jgi:pyruvate, water dikinase